MKHGKGLLTTINDYAGIIMIPFDSIDIYF